MRRLAKTLRGPVALLLLLAAAALLPAAGDDDGKVRGVTISTHTDGREWGWDVIAPTMEQIRDVGAGWVQTHPYGGIRGDGSVRFRAFDPDSPPAHLVRPIREAHRLGLRILIKPHLAYWGSPFGWRGDIEFGDDAEWSRFFDSYEEWIVGLARACRDADAFVVGTELDRTLAHEQRWRRIIARVREVTDAPLTYAVNWSDYRTVPFWDALDVIGIQAYFPVTEEPTPSDETLEAGWRRLMGELRDYGTSLNRKVVFTELGYNRSLNAASQPWDPRVDGPEAEAFQARCLRIALQAIEREPVVVGSFLWKWFPDPHPVGRNFQLATPRLRRVIAEVWSAGAADRPSPVSTAQ